jgi:hypothetical protein
MREEISLQLGHGTTGEFRLRHVKFQIAANVNQSAAGAD